MAQGVLFRPEAFDLPFPFQKKKKITQHPLAKLPPLSEQTQCPAPRHPLFHCHLHLTCFEQHLTQAFSHFALIPCPTTYQGYFTSQSCCLHVGGLGEGTQALLRRQLVTAIAESVCREARTQHFFLAFALIHLPSLHQFLFSLELLTGFF